MGIGDRLKDITRKAQDSAAEQREQLAEKGQTVAAEHKEKLHDMVEKAQTAAAEHREQIHGAVEKAQAAADRQTGGQYHEQILKAAARVESYVDAMKPPAKGAEGEAPAGEPGRAKRPDPPASSG